MVTVCLDKFKGVLDVSRFRIYGILSRFRKTGKLCKENRGCNKIPVKNKLKKVKVIQFIIAFKCSEPHYCAKHTGRKYISSELKI